MIEAIAYILVGLGLVAAVILYARRPDFWIDFGLRLFFRLQPIIWAYISKRMPPEDEAAWRKCMLRGGKWDHRKRRCDR